MAEQYSRLIPFEKILNFRDLGGYKVRGGRTVAWRRVYRSGEMHLMTGRDIIHLKEEIKVKTVIDLRGSRRLKVTGTGPLDKVGVKYFDVPLTIVSQSDMDKENGAIWKYTNSGEIYYHRLRLKEYGLGVVEALEIIAGPENHPLVFHCNAGKDRSGILAAILLSALGVADKDIIDDYMLTDLYMKDFIDRWNNDPLTAEVHNNLPEYHLKAVPESMELFLAALKKDYGSAEGYLKAQGTESSLVLRLEKALLTFCHS